jgi:SAM-dependent methyltransferase
VHDFDTLAAEQAREPEDAADVAPVRPTEHDRLEAERACVLGERAETVHADEQRLEADGVEPGDRREQAPFRASRPEVVDDVGDADRGAAYPALVPSTFTSGYGARLRSYREIYAHQARYAIRAADNAFAFWRHTSSLLKPGGSVLEIGCGSRAGTLILHHTAGAKAVGIDYDAPAIRWSGLLEQLRRNGVERAAKTLARRLVFDGRYYRRLEQLYGSPLRKDVDARWMDARRLSFDDASFDLVYSSAVFEHIDGVEAAAAEIARVLRPGGTAWIGVHLYPSLSGGHVLAWADPANPPASPPPWDHLRQRTQPTHVYLNGLRADDYLEIFARHFTVASCDFVSEGEDLVTDEIVAETGYSRDELIRASLEVTLTR